MIPRIFKYVLIGILFMTPGEFLINVFVKGSLAYYFLAVLFYALLIFISYGLWKLTSRMRSQWLEFTLSSLLFGFLGLMGEWFILGNAPWLNPDAVQLGMVAWWIGVFLVPRLFLEDDSYRDIKKFALWFHVIFSLVYLIVSALGRLAIGIVIFGYGMVVWLPLYILYIRRKWKLSKAVSGSS